jgi:hypothetical protein
MDPREDSVKAGNGNHFALLARIRPQRRLSSGIGELDHASQTEQQRAAGGSN